MQQLWENFSESEAKMNRQETEEAVQKISEHFLFLSIAGCMTFGPFETLAGMIRAMQQITLNGTNTKDQRDECIKLVKAGLEGILLNINEEYSEKQ